jgi:hypothetical protein
MLSARQTVTGDSRPCDSNLHACTGCAGGDFWTFVLKWQAHNLFEGCAPSWWPDDRMCSIRSRRVAALLYGEGFIGNISRCNESSFKHISFLRG